ncbi:hypothetical protein HanIR_Chr11g0547951 [Helianthus annuus]|nr:hypothetical protein HanIR_Chr11g0547951 [Helianthus annuus]
MDDLIGPPSPSSTTSSPIDPTLGLLRELGPTSTKLSNKAGDLDCLTCGVAPLG